MQPHVAMTENQKRDQEQLRFGPCMIRVQRWMEGWMHRWTRDRATLFAHPQGQPLRARWMCENDHHSLAPLSHKHAEKHSQLFIAEITEFLYANSFAATLSKASTNRSPLGVKLRLTPQLGIPSRASWTTIQQGGTTKA